MKRIVLATDLSARSDRAMHRAVVLARDLGAELTVMHIVDDSLLDAIALQHEAAARAAIAQQVALIPGAEGLSISQKVVRGVDYRDISVLAAELGADLIVLGIHRHSSRELFRGTTAERVIRLGTLPVLVVKDAVKAAYRRIMVAVDLSEHSHAAVSLAASLAPKGELRLLHACHRPFTAFLGRESQNALVAGERARITHEIGLLTQKLASQLGDAAPSFEIVLHEGDVCRVIREQVAAWQPDLLAVGTHGRTGLGRALIGSIAEDILTEAPVDVLAVKAR